MDGLLNHARRAAQEAMNARPNTRAAIVDGYDPARHLVRVRVQPEDVLTDWIPVKALAVGSGWGMVFAPSIGDVLDIEFTSGTPDGASAGLRYFSDQANPPNVPSGECWIVHKTGSSIKLTTDGKLTLTDAAGTILALDNAGNVAITGNVTVTGKSTAQGDVIGNGTSLHTHIHSGVTAGGGNTGAPV
jgi:phage baseplate assembly protein gpV